MMKNVSKMLARLKDLRLYISIGTFYMATDLAYDYGLLRLGYPFGDLLYFGRYGMVIAWILIKFCKKKGLTQKIRTRLSRSHAPLPAPKM